MKILIVYFSNSGNTKRVVDLLGEKLTTYGEVTIKNALTVKHENVEWADVLIIGSPIHGYILFGQKFCSQVMKFLTTILPGKALNKVEKLIISKNGQTIGKQAKKRNKKEELSESIKNIVTTII